MMAIETATPIISFFFIKKPTLSEIRAILKSDERNTAL